MFRERFQFQTIRTKLFLAYSSLIVGIVAVLSLAYYVYTSKILTERASESLFQSAAYTTDRLDAEFSFMDSTAVKMIFSKKTKELFFADLNPDDQDAIFQNERQLNDIVYSIMGPSASGWQINLFDSSGRFYGTGNYTKSVFYPSEKMKGLAWVDETIALAGGKHFSVPHADDWSKDGGIVVSLSRLFMLDLGSRQQGIVEIQMKYDKLAGLVSSFMADSSGNRSPGMRIYIMNERGELIYPYSSAGSATAQAYWNAAGKLRTPTGTLACRDPAAGGTDICGYARSETTGWTVIASQSKAMLLQPVITFRNTMLVGVFGLLLLTLLVSFFVAKGLTNPIKAIHSSIRALSIENLLPTSERETNKRLNELQLLDISFRRMCVRLKDSIEEALESRSKEMQARMLALQAQINPHFLYNTITNISVMAEERGQDDIVKICKNLSRMFRYILSGSGEQATLGDELVYAENYLSLMQIRYASLLSYAIEVDEELSGIPVPKLIVQPIIENCIKHGIHVRPPWSIRIKGYRSGRRWVLEIVDNGTGFEPEVLAQLGGDPSRSVGDRSSGDGFGMGLANIAERLRLLYGGEAVFELSNPPGGGACVTIGGIIDPASSESVPIYSEVREA
ncbi:cache domain-containing sensor histidine kinase [Cohnella sp. 56]|uniref:cache domain-containing sensor histidine kinase n=1 Tax=Cohnella sp. 56 TaxID=3113722 RepID=UPI0030E7636D